MDYHILPKVELHLHLDCSLSFKLVNRLIPGISPETYRHSFVAPAKCTDLADYIQRALAAIALMQTRENLILVVEDLFEQLKQDNIIYAELRFAPLEHTAGGLKPEEVVDIINQSVDQCIGDFGIQAGIILCTLRHYSADQSMQTVKLVERFTGTRVVGFDIASDEAGYPIDNHVAAFKYARDRGISCTAHAGEAKGPESVWETLEHFCPSRIGHGVRSAEDDKLVTYLKHRDIHLEVCPTSNVQTNVFPEIEDHNIDKLYHQGVSLSVNTDCRTISDVTLSGEYALLHKVFNWGPEQVYRCNVEAVKHAFAPETVKKDLLKQLAAGFANLPTHQT